MVIRWRWSVACWLLIASALAPALAAGRPQKGDRAPGFALRDLSGETVALECLAGKVVLVEFWTSWCPECRTSLPYVQRLAHSPWAQAGKLVVLGINAGEDHADVTRYLEQQRHDFRALLDGDGRVCDAYGIREIPQYVVIDRQGRIFTRVLGYEGKKTATQLTTAVYNALLKEDDPPADDVRTASSQPES